MFTSSASRNSSAVRLGNRVDRARAALLIRMSIRPKRSRAPRVSASGNSRHGNIAGDAECAVAEVIGGDCGPRLIANVHDHRSAALVQAVLQPPVRDRGRRPSRSPLAPRNRVRRRSSRVSLCQDPDRQREPPILLTSSTKRASERSGSNRGSTFRSTSQLLSRSSYAFCSHARACSLSPSPA